MDKMKKLTDLLGKYRYAALILLIGLTLMLLPTGSKTKQMPEEQQTLQQTQGIDEELTQILASIQGVGKVQVMLTVEEGERILYQTDEGSTSTNTVIITDSDRAESGLVQQIDPPQYRGAIVVCQGADRPSVRLSVIEAVASVTGLSTDRIRVLKMK